MQWVPGQPLPMAGDFLEWPSWEAPRFLIMEPLGDIGPVAQQEPFNSDTAQERLDAIDTKFTLRYFEHRYVDKLRIALRHVAGEAAVYMAMHGVPPPAALLGESTNVSVSAIEGKSTVVPKRPPKKTRADKRHDTIYGIIQSGLKGREYCKCLDERGVKPPPEWLAEGWPGSYAQAYDAPKVSDRQKWRAKIQKEKTRHKNK